MYKKILDNISKREEEILLLMAEGKSNSQIAEELDISYHTVKTHISHILAKMEVRDRLGAVVKALRTGRIK